MAIIPAEEKVFMVSNSTNTTYSGSAALKAMQQWYTMQDVSDSIQPYKVFTALLTQSGGDDPDSKTDGLTTIGVSYTIANYLEGDFTIIGAPNNLVGTSFIATGTTPDWGSTEGSELSYNTGAPVATVLENTIGNVWFTYSYPGGYSCSSENLFINSKSTMFLGGLNWDGGSGILKSGFDGEGYGAIVTTNFDGDPSDNGLLYNVPIEIRVYN